MCLSDQSKVGAENKADKEQRRVEQQRSLKVFRNAEQNRGEKSRAKRLPHIKQKQIDGRKK
jgi:hypothetical protein